MDMTRAIRFVVLLMVAGTLIYLFFLLEPEKPLAQVISIGSAYASMLYLAVALSIGPLNLIRSKRNPLSSFLRRDIGICAALMAVVHTVAGLQVHLGGRFIEYFIFPPDSSRTIPFRYDPFGLTNYVGLICTLIMLALLCLSNNRSLRAMGASSWKKWQRLAYLLVPAIPAHGLIYQFLEKRVGLYTVLLLAITLAIFAAQSSGFMHYRRTRDSQSLADT